MNKIFFGIKRAIEESPNDIEIYRDYLTLCKNENNHEQTKELRKMISKVMGRIGNPEDFYEVWKESLRYDAPYDFDAFLLYIELDREKPFYPPRRKQLLPLVKAMQELEEGKLELLSISMPPRTGKTTLALFYCAWVAGRNPHDTILMSSHNKALLGDCYAEVLRLLDGNGEYLYTDVFRVSIARTNALDMKIDINTAKRFANFQFGSVEAQLAGRVNATRLLYCDDLVEGIEEAMSKERLDKKIRQYTVNLEQRRERSKSDNTLARELHIATRWSVHDVLGHLERREENNPKAKFIVVPALNENGESNFDYNDGVGFSTEDYLKLRSDFEKADELASWGAIYQGHPIEREGLLYERDKLRRYAELPAVEPDGIVAVVDTKTTGNDFCCMPVAYIYGEDFYIEDCVFSNEDANVIEDLLCEKLTSHKVQVADFESNSAGSVIANNVKKRLTSKCNIKTHFTGTNKETKIIVNAGWVKEHCLFKMEYTRDYGKMLDALCSYVQAGKNKHDDAPDAFAQLALFAQNRISAKATVMKRIF